MRGERGGARSAGRYADGMDPHPRRPLRWLWLLVAYLALALGALGVLLPGLPTTPFVLLAAFAAARGSARLHAWLHAHRLFGPIIRDWERDGAVSRRAKRVAIATMAACAVLMVLTAPRWWMSATGIAAMALVGAWLWMRPEPPPGRPDASLQARGS